MKPLKLLPYLALIAALIFPTGFALAQNRQADVDAAKQLLESNPTRNNRLRLATLQYLQGVDYLNAGNLEMAANSMQASVWTLEDSKGQIEGTDPVFEEARYGLSYVLWKNNQSYEALLVLDKLTTTSPNMQKGRYLQGATLISLSGKKSFDRGVEILRQLAVDGTGDNKTMAEHAATRASYDISTLDQAQGQAQAALDVMNSLKSAIGLDKGATDAENQMVLYGMGVYLEDTGDLTDALGYFEDVNRANSSFALANGTTLHQVMSNAYYQSGLDYLGQGGADAARQAVDMFDQAGKLGGETVDVHHGKAVAYAVMGENGNVARELVEIKALDSGYYDKIAVEK